LLQIYFRYGSAKFIKIGQYLPELLTKVCCHVFYAPQCMFKFTQGHSRSECEQI